MGASTRQGDRAGYSNFGRRVNFLRLAAAVWSRTADRFALERRQALAGQLQLCSRSRDQLLRASRRGDGVADAGAQCDLAGARARHPWRHRAGVRARQRLCSKPAMRPGPAECGARTGQHHSVERVGARGHGAGREGPSAPTRITTSSARTQRSRQASTATSASCLSGRPRLLRLARCSAGAPAAAQPVCRFYASLDE